MNAYDLIIVGAGPAGLTAAIYARRAGKTVLLIEKGAFGGQMTFSPKIENYPGFEALSGNELADKMVSQALELGAEVEVAAVCGLEKCPDGSKLLRTEDGGEYSGKAVILATGAKHRLLGVPGEAELVGKGISFCAVCDGAFYEGKEVAVIGGGNSALQEALLLCKTAESVTVVQNLPYFTGEKTLLQKLEKEETVRLLPGRSVKGFCKENDRIVMEALTENGASERIPVDGVFVAVGLEPDNRPFAELVKLENGYVYAEEDCMTSCPGVFAAGDCRKKQIRQITTATGDGAVAALAACRYIDDRF